MIEFYGNGGQTFIPNDIGLKKAENYMQANDPVARLNWSVGKKVREAKGHTYDVYSIGRGGEGNAPNVGAHGWVDNYQQLYQNPKGVTRPQGTTRLQYPP